MIPLVDLAARHRSCADDVEQAVLSVLRSGHWIGGPVVAELETQMAMLMNRLHAVGVANGTDALELSLQVLGVGPGDEVIAPDVSFFATLMTYAFAFFRTYCVSPWSPNLSSNLSHLWKKIFVFFGIYTLFMKQVFG